MKCFFQQRKYTDFKNTLQMGDLEGVTEDFVKRTI